MIFFMVYLLLGCLSGFLAGVFGIGGGMVIVPALVYLTPFLGFPPEHQMSLILGTSFACIVITTFSSTQRHYKLGHIDWTALKFLAPSMVITAALACRMISQLDSQIVLKIFACLLLYIAFSMATSIKKEVQTKALTPLGAILGGVGISLAASAAGIGGGGFTVPFLNHRGVPMKQAIGSSAFCSMVLGLSNALSYLYLGLSRENLPEYSLGYIYLPALLGITLTSFFTAKLGAKMVARLPVQTLKRTFACLLILLAIDMFLK